MLFLICYSFYTYKYIDQICVFCSRKLFGVEKNDRKSHIQKLEKCMQINNQAWGLPFFVSKTFSLSYATQQIKPCFFFLLANRNNCTIVQVGYKWPAVFLPVLSFERRSTVTELVQQQWSSRTQASRLLEAFGKKTKAIGKLLLILAAVIEMYNFKC